MEIYKLCFQAFWLSQDFLKIYIHMFSTLNDTSEVKLGCFITNATHHKSGGTQFVELANVKLVN
jgi:hypothetical protein